MVISMILNFLDRLIINTALRKFYMNDRFFLNTNNKVQSCLLAEAQVINKG